MGQVPNLFLGWADIEPSPTATNHLHCYVRFGLSRQVSCYDLLKLVLIIFTCNLGQSTVKQMLEWVTELADGSFIFK